MLVPAVLIDSQYLAIRVFPSPLSSNSIGIKPKLLGVSFGKMLLIRLANLGPAGSTFLVDTKEWSPRESVLQTFTNSLFGPLSPVCLVWSDQTSTREDFSTRDPLPIGKRPFPESPGGGCDVVKKKPIPLDQQFARNPADPTRAK